MATKQTQGMSLLQAARLTYEVFGAGETERALAEVFLMPDDEIRKVMQQLNASQN